MTDSRTGRGSFCANSIQRSHRRVALLVACAATAVAPTVRAANPVSTNLLQNLHTDTSNNSTWEDQSGGPNRSIVGGANSPSLNLDERSLLNINSSYSYNGNAAASAIFSGNLDLADFAATNANLRNASFEMWFDPTNATTARQILWETGGGTGAGLVLDQGTLEFRVSPGGAVATADITSLAGNGGYIQAAWTIDLTNNTVQLYVNGQSTSAGVPIAAAGDLTNWAGGDGDGLGGRGQNNLGGFGNGFSHPAAGGSADGNYNALNGKIAIFRAYGTSDAGTGVILSDAEILQNYKAIRPDIVETAFATGTGAQNFNWNDGATWQTGVKPTADENAYIFNEGTGNDSVVVDTTESVFNIVIGRNGSAGLGMLTVNTGGNLSVTRNLTLGATDTNSLNTQVTQNDGVVTIGADLVFGEVGREGGTYDLNGGTLTIAGSVIERVTNVNGAQLYVDGGTLNVTGNISVQSFRTGDGNGSTGTYTLTAGKTIDNTGTFVAGNAGNGTFINDGGTLLISNGLVLADGATGQGFFQQNSGSTVITAGRFQIGDTGNASTLRVDGGTFEALASNLEFGTGGSGGGDGGTFEINGGTVQLGANISVNTANASASGTISLNGGRLEMVTSPSTATRNITTFNHADGATLMVTLDGTNLTPINVAGTATFAAATTNGGSKVELNYVPPVGGATLAFDGGTGDWETAANWETDTLPAVGSGFIATGDKFTFLSAGTLTNAASALSVTPDWSVVVNGNDLQFERTGGNLGGPSIAVIDNPASVVSRSTTLNIQPAGGVGADAASLQVSAGSLTLSATSDLVIGGSVSGVVDHSGGTITIGRDLLFGGGLGTQGGNYNLLPGATLTVNGGIYEGTAATPDATVSSAQLLIDGGTLNVAGPIVVQRFAVGDVGGDGSYTIAAGKSVTSTGDTVVGGSKVGVLNIDSGGTVSSNLLRVGDVATTGDGTINLNGGAWTVNEIAYIGDDGVGKVNLNSGTFTVLGSAGAAKGIRLGQIAGANGTLTIGPVGGATAPTVKNSGGNIEVGVNAGGTMTVNSGVFYQEDNFNLVVGQIVGSVGLLEVKGGTLDMRGSGGTGLTSDTNINGGSGTINVTGGTFWIARDLNLTNNASGTARVNFSGGITTILGDVHYRNGGDDIINVTGGTLDMAGGTVNMSNEGGTTTNQFNFTGGTIKDIANFIGDLTQTASSGPSTLQIGASPGKMTVTGNYTLAGGTIEIELPANPATGVAGADYDLLEITGAGAFNDGGKIELVLGAYTPADGDRWNIVDAVGITSSYGDINSLFDTSSAPLAGGLVWDFSSFTTDGTVGVMVPEPTLLAPIGLLGLLALRRRRCGM